MVAKLGQRPYTTRRRRLLQKPQATGILSVFARPEFRKRSAACRRQSARFLVQNGGPLAQNVHEKARRLERGDSGGRGERSARACAILSSSREDGAEEGNIVIKLALTDLDDTLIPFGSPCASARSREAIHALLDAGLHFGPVTGRLPVDMGWMFSDDAACYATGAFANGQVVRVDSQIVREVYISAAALEKTQAVLDAAAGGYLCLYDPWTLGKISYITAHEARLRDDPPPTYGSITSILASVGEFPASNADADDPAYIKANVQTTCSRERMVELRDLLREEVPELGFVFPNEKAQVIDVVPKNWGKGDGVRVLTEALGLSPDEVVAFGDSENDLAMMGAVKNSVAVANATEQVSKVAAWHIGACADGAVDDALIQIVAASKAGELPRFMCAGGGSRQ